MRLLRRHGLGRAQPAHRPAAARAAPQPRPPEPSAPAWLAGTPDRADDDVITLGGILGRDYHRTCCTAIERLIAAWQAKTGSRSPRARHVAIGGALGAAIVILAMLGVLRPGGPAGAAGCALPGPHQVAAVGYQPIRAQVAGAQQPDLRPAATSSIDLLAAPSTARRAGGYEAAGFYQRLARACARHGSKMRIPGTVGPPRPPAPAPPPACLTWRPAGGARLNSEICGYSRAALG